NAPSGRAVDASRLARPADRVRYELRQGERGAGRVRGGMRRGLDDPRCRHDCHTGGPAQVPQAPAEWYGRLRERLAPGLSAARACDEIPQLSRQQGVLLPRELDRAAAGQRYALRHQGALAERLPADAQDRQGALGRFRSAVRRRAPEAEDPGNPRSLSRTAKWKIQDAGHSRSGALFENLLARLENAPLPGHRAMVAQTFGGFGST